MVYLIQGVFFQGARHIHHGRDGGIAFPIANSGIAAFHFAGIIRSDPDSVHSRLTGSMHDVFGQSTLSEIIMEETGIRFTKNYPGRDPVFYGLRKQPDGTFLGKYEGKMGSFTARCIIAQVPEDFFALSWENVPIPA